MPLIISGGGSASTVTWANVTGKPTTLANFDVNATDIGDEKILQWDATESEWVYVENSGGVTVDTTPTDGDTTDAISSDWAYDHENAALSTGKAHVPDNSSAADNSFLAKDGTWQVPSGTGTGEANGGINIGTAGVGIFDSKSGVNLQFKKINAGSNKITITDDTANDEVDIDVDTSNFGLSSTDISDFDTEVGNNTTVTRKADKVTSPTENNFAALNASGNLIDSGHKDADYADASHNHTASEITDFDTEVSNNTDVDANTTARHDAVTVTDSSEIDFTLDGQDITASIVAGSIDETKLDTSVNASLDLADSALQSSDNISELTNDSSYITSSGVTYEALNGNSDVGTGSSQVAAGNHNHTGTYEPVLNANQKVAITTGTTDPDDGEGSNGDIYIKYTA